MEGGAMAPQKQNSAAGSHPVAPGSGGRAHGLQQAPAAAGAAAKKPSLQHVQADHELFLQAFESESIFTNTGFAAGSKGAGSWEGAAGPP